MISPHHSHPTNGVGPSNSNSKTDYTICTVGVGCSF